MGFPERLRAQVKIVASNSKTETWTSGVKDPISVTELASSNIANFIARKSAILIER